MQQAQAVQLFLFDVGPDMAKIRLSAAAMKRCRRSKSTLVGYGCDWRAFEVWCGSVGRAALPATGETLSLYVAARLEAGLKCASMARHVAAVAYRHRADGLAVPDRAEARAVMAGAKRQRKEQPNAKAALTVGDVRAIAAKLLRGGSVCGARDRALLTLGFATGLRRSNLVGLDRADVRFVARKGVAVSVRSSKTDQEGRGQVIGVFRGVREETCPVRALRAWLAVRGEDAGPLFTRVRAGDVATLERLGGEAVCQLVQQWAAMIGLDRRLYGGHSLRAGFVTAAHNAGCGTLAIMARTGHQSVEMVKRYLRNSDPFAGANPLARAL